MFVLVGYDDTIGGFNGYALGIGDHTSPSDKFQGWVGSIAFLPTSYTFTSTEAWYHVLMRRANGTTSFFVNGALVSQFTVSTPLTPTDFTIGSINNNRFFNGSLDEVRIYDRALSDAEVTQLYQAEAALPIMPVGNCANGGPLPNVIFGIGQPCPETSGTLTAGIPASVKLVALGGLRYVFSGPGGTLAGIVEQFNGTRQTAIGGYLINETPLPPTGWAMVDQPGTYTVLVTGENGCTAIASLTVTAIRCPTGQ